jgi:uncharacterized protein YeeX (DUF496 family)
VRLAEKLEKVAHLEDREAVITRWFADQAFHLRDGLAVEEMTKLLTTMRAELEEAVHLYDKREKELSIEQEKARKHQEEKERIHCLREINELCGEIRSWYRD